MRRHACTTRSKKKQREIRFGVVCFIDQIGCAHRNRYKYYYFPGVIVLSTVSSLAGKTRPMKRIVYFTNNHFLCSTQRYYPSRRYIVYSYLWQFYCKPIIYAILNVIECKLKFKKIKAAKDNGDSRQISAWMKARFQVKRNILFLTTHSRVRVRCEVSFE